MNDYRNIEGSVDELLEEADISYKATYRREAKAFDDKATMDMWDISFECLTKPNGAYEFFDFYTGIGNRKKTSFGETPVKPTAATVLYSLIGDANAINMTFDEWCAEYGYDNDSRKAEKTFNQCKEGGEKLKRIFNDDLINKLKELLQDY